MKGKLKRSRASRRNLRRLSQHQDRWTAEALRLKFLIYGRYMKPHGIPYHSVMNEDLSFTIVGVCPDPSAHQSSRPGSRCPMADAIAQGRPYDGPTV